MKQILTIIMNQFGKSLPNNIPLGRWNANEDHCGPCGQYNITNKQNDKLITNQKQNLSNRSI
jgi:hypothetical protein